MGGTIKELKTSYTQLFFIKIPPPVIEKIYPSHFIDPYTVCFQ